MTMKSAATVALCALVVLLAPQARADDSALKTTSNSSNSVGERTFTIPPVTVDPTRRRQLRAGNNAGTANKNGTKGVVLPEGTWNLSSLPIGGPPGFAPGQEETYYDENIRSFKLNVTNGTERGGEIEDVAPMYSGGLTEESIRQGATMGLHPFELADAFAEEKNSTPGGINMHS